MTLEDCVVLVVEDEDDSILMISQVLEYYRVEFHIARDGRECIEMLKTLRPHLIVMDLAMPHMDGWETLAKIRANSEIADIPVVASTAFHSLNVADGAMEAGFDGYFPKPVDAPSLIAYLQAIK